MAKPLSRPHGLAQLIAVALEGQSPFQITANEREKERERGLGRNVSNASSFALTLSALSHFHISKSVYLKSKCLKWKLFSCFLVFLPSLLAAVLAISNRILVGHSHSQDDKHLRTIRRCCSGPCPVPAHSQRQRQRLAIAATTIMTLWKNDYPAGLPAEPASSQSWAKPPVEVTPGQVY